MVEGFGTRVSAPVPFERASLSSTASALINTMASLHDLAYRL